MKQQPKPHMLVWKISVKNLESSLESWDRSWKFWAEKWHYLSYISTRIPQTLLKLHRRGTRTKTRSQWQIYSDFWEGMMVPNRQVTEKKQGKVRFYIFINKKKLERFDVEKCICKCVEENTKNNKYCVLKKKNIISIAFIISKFYNRRRKKREC